MPRVSKSKKQVASKAKAKKPAVVAKKAKDSKAKKAVSAKASAKGSKLKATAKKILKKDIKQKATASKKPALKAKAAKTVKAAPKASKVAKSAKVDKKAASLKARFSEKIKEKSKTASKIVAKSDVVKAKVAIKPNNEATLSYTQIEFYDNVKAFCGLEKRNQAKELCDDIASFILDALSKGYKVPFLGLGKLYVRKTKARVVRNPSTGETVHLKARNRVRFAPAKSLANFSE